MTAILSQPQCVTIITILSVGKTCWYILIIALILETFSEGITILPKQEQYCYIPKGNIWIIYDQDNLSNKEHQSNEFAAKLYALQANMAGPFLLKCCTIGVW